MELQYIFFFMRAVLTNFLVMFYIYSDYGLIALATIILSAIYFGIYILLWFTIPKLAFGKRFEINSVIDAAISGIPLLIFILTLNIPLMVTIIAIIIMCLLIFGPMLAYGILA
ncbi:MAG: hypothetical protein GF364_20435 [Candidatus Lokiarchaeota archaeon]|nr:hypothetical protein [Candidatus Lokiarchaeota archaeon]